VKPLGRSKPAGARNRDKDHTRQWRCVMGVNLVVGDVDAIIRASRGGGGSCARSTSCGRSLVRNLPWRDLRGRLLFLPACVCQVAGSLDRLSREVRRITLIAGYPEYVGTKIFNFGDRDSRTARERNHRKACLPNYSGFGRKALILRPAPNPLWSTQRRKSRRAG